jgi:cytochrome P450
MIAGSDTAGKAIKRTIYHVASNTRVCEALTQEIELAASEGRISTPVTYQEAQKMPYLQVSPN